MGNTPIIIRFRAAASLLLPRNALASPPSPHPSPGKKSLYTQSDISRPQSQTKQVGEATARIRATASPTFIIGAGNAYLRFMAFLASALALFALRRMRLGV